MVSVERHCQEDVEWTIVCDRGEAGKAPIPKSPKINIRVVEIQEKWPEAAHLGSGYIQQQWVKMNAHRVMGDGYFLNWDSDVIALRPFNESNFKNSSGKPILWFTPFNDLILGGDAAIHQLRRQYIANVFSIPDAPIEWMRCMPLWMNGEILKFGESRPEWERARILMRSNAVNGLSEFNLIGQLSNMFFPDAYDYKNTFANETWAGPIDSKTAIVHQAWSWGGVNDQVKAIAHGL